MEKKIPSKASSNRSANSVRKWRTRRRPTTAIVVVVVIVVDVDRGPGGAGVWPSVGVDQYTDAKTLTHTDTHTHTHTHTHRHRHTRARVAGEEEGSSVDCRSAIERRSLQLSGCAVGRCWTPAAIFIASVFHPTRERERERERERKAQVSSLPLLPQFRYVLEFFFHVISLLLTRIRGHLDRFRVSHIVHLHVGSYAGASLLTDADTHTRADEKRETIGHL